MNSYTFEEVLKDICINNNVSYLKQILDIDFEYDLSFNDNYLIRLAIINNNIEIVKLLLNDYRVDVNEGNIVKDAALNGKVEILELLLNDKNISKRDIKSVINSVSLTINKTNKEIVKLLMMYLIINNRSLTNLNIPIDVIEEIKNEVLYRNRYINTYLDDLTHVDDMKRLVKTYLNFSKNKKLSKKIKRKLIKQ